MGRHVAALVGGLLLLVTMPRHVTAQAVGLDDVLDIAFPVAGPVTFTDDYDHVRGGGSRRHQATDVFGRKLQLVFATVDGAICRITGIDEPEPSFGYQLRICGVDGRIYHYVHLNNDRPGTDDGLGGPEWAYAPGIRLGTSVRRGQWLGFVGDSGNAEDTPPHLHLSITDPRLADASIADPPWEPDRLNPFRSLEAAHARGDVPTPTLTEGDRGPLVRVWQGLLDHVLERAVAVDGDFGPLTRSATAALQAGSGIAPAEGTARGLEWEAALHLVDDGDRIGGDDPVATDAALDTQAAGDDPTPVDVTAGDEDVVYPGRLLRLQQPNARGADVQLWQERLGVLDTVAGDGAPPAADGIFGPLTDQATRAFQEAHGLVVDGIVGPRTWGAAFGS